MDPKFQFLGFDCQNFGEHCSRPKMHILARNDTFWAVVGPDLTRHVVPLCTYKIHRRKFGQLWDNRSPLDVAGKLQ